MRGAWRGACIGKASRVWWCECRCEWCEWCEWCGVARLARACVRVAAARTSVVEGEADACALRGVCAQ